MATERKKRKKKKPPLTPQEKSARTRKRARIMITLLTILVLDFILSSINYALEALQGSFSPYLLTAVGMLLVILIFYPAMFVAANIHSLTDKVIGSTMKFGAHMWGRRQGYVVIFISLVFLLYCGFYWAWFKQVPFANLDLPAINPNYK